MEVLPEADVLDLIPAQPHTETQAAARQYIQCGGLLGDQGGLPLRQDEDAGQEAEPRRAGRHEAVQDQRLQEGGLVRVWPLPASRPLRIGAQHMVVGHDVREAESLHRLGEIADRRRVGRELGLRVDDTEIHEARWYLLNEVGARRAVPLRSKIARNAGSRANTGEAPEDPGASPLRLLIRNAAPRPARGRRRAWPDTGRRTVRRRPRRSSPTTPRPDSPPGSGRRRRRGRWPRPAWPATSQTPPRSARRS